MMDLKAAETIIDAVHLLEGIGIIDFNGHASLRAGPDRMMINSAASVRCALVPEDILLIDLDGRVIEGEGSPPMEFHLHAAIYRARPDVGGIVHGHPKWSTVLTMTGNSYKPVFPQGSLLGKVPVHPSPESINSRDAGDRVAALLDDGIAALLKSHGCVVTGKDLKDAAVLAIYLEENAHRQYLAAAMGEPYVLNEDEIAQFRKGLWKPHLFQKAWDYFTAKRVVSP